MISGKKIKMKVKKSKKDKQVISQFHLCNKKVCLFFHVYQTVYCTDSCVWFYYSGIKIEQNSLSSWTQRCDAPVELVLTAGHRRTSRTQETSPASYETTRWAGDCKWLASPLEAAQSWMSERVIISARSLTAFVMSEFWSRFGGNGNWLPASLTCQLCLWF